MKKNNTLTFGQWVLIFIAFVLGFLTGKIFTVPGISISKEINPLHGISIFCSVFIAVYISIIFAKYKENQKTQKTLLFKRLDDLLEHTNFVDTNISNGLNCAKVYSILKKIVLLSEHICKLLDLIGVKKDSFNNVVLNSHKELRVLMTHTPANREGNLDQPVKCENGIYEYSKEQSAKIEVEISNIENITFQLQVDISQK